MAPPSVVARVGIGLPLVIAAVSVPGGAAQAQPAPSATNVPSQSSATTVPAQPSEPSPPFRATANEGSRRVVDWELGVRSVLTLSDNLGRAEAGSKRDGARLEVSPFITGLIDRPRQQALLTYRMRNFYQSLGRGYDGPRHQLNSFGNLALHDDWLWLGAQAQVFDQAADPFRLNADDPSSQRENRSRLVMYQLGPYVRKRLDAATDYQAGYVFGYTNYGANRISITHHGVNGRITRDPALRSLGWHVAARASRDEYDSGADVDRDDFRVVGLLRATRQLRVGAGIEYSRISVVANMSGSTGGWGPTAQLNWAPSPATSVHLRTTFAYYGNAGFARLSHQAGRWLFALRYDQGIVFGSEASLSYSPLAAPFEIGEPGPGHNQTVDNSVARGTLPLAGMPLASGLVGGALVDSRRLGLTALWTDARNAVSLSAFSSNSRSIRTNIALPSVAHAPAEIDRTGAILQYSRRLSPRTSAEFHGARMWSETPDDSMSTNLTLLTVALRYRMTRKAITGLAYRHSRQRSTAGLNGYDENAILASIDVRF